jgi:hypothetical protein
MTPAALAKCKTWTRQWHGGEGLLPLLPLAWLFDLVQAVIHLPPSSATLVLVEISLQSGIGIVVSSGPVPPFSLASSALQPVHTLHELVRPPGRNMCRPLPSLCPGDWPALVSRSIPTRSACITTHGTRGGRAGGRIVARGGMSSRSGTRCSTGDGRIAPPGDLFPYIIDEFVDVTADGFASAVERYTGGLAGDDVDPHERERR